MTDIIFERWTCETGLPFNTIAAGSAPVVFSASTDGPLEDDDQKVWDEATRRLVACANVCAGIPTEVLEAISGPTSTGIGRLLALRSVAEGAAKASWILQPRPTA